jgi:hypothetical protein
MPLMKSAAFILSLVSGLAGTAACAADDCSPPNSVWIWNGKLYQMDQANLLHPALDFEMPSSNLQGPKIRQGLRQSIRNCCENGQIYTAREFRKPPALVQHSKLADWYPKVVLLNPGQTPNHKYQLEIRGESDSCWAPTNRFAIPGFMDLDREKWNQIFAE